VRVVFSDEAVKSLAITWASGNLRNNIKFVNISKTAPKLMLYRGLTHSRITGPSFSQKKL